MASRNFHKRRTKERKASQVEGRRIARLRRRVSQMAGEYGVDAMSVAQLQRAAKRPTWWLPGISRQ